MGLSADWNSLSFPGSTIPLQQQVPTDSMIREGEPSHSIGVQDAGRRSTLFEQGLTEVVSRQSLKQAYGSFYNDTEGPRAFDQMEVTEPPWNVREMDYERMKRVLESFQNVLPGFALPSRHTLTRYLSGYFSGFHDHLPFIHVPTFRLEDCAPELVLAIAAVGAQHRFENQNGLKLFDAARAVSLEQRRRRSRNFAEARPDRTGTTAPNRRLRSHDSQPLCRDLEFSDESRRARMQTVQALLLVMTFATWEDHPEMMREASELQSSLARCIRELGLKDSPVSDETDSISWSEWAKVEGDRRTKLHVFCSFMIHTATYNLPPVLLGNELHLRLPCSSHRWNARTESEWQALKGSESNAEPLFRDAFSSLFSKPSQAPVLHAHFTSPLGNFVLILALIQRSFCIHQLSWLTDTETSDLKEQLERALQLWKLGWQRSPESSLDPQNPNGPIPFTSTCFLALAHVRLVLDIGPHRDLHTRDPLLISAALQELPRVERSRMVIPALLHSAHALSIPIKLGIDFVAKSQHFFWGIYHSVCSFECAVFLSRWLYQVESEGIKGNDVVGEYEERILQWVKSIVKEARYSIDIFGSSQENDEISAYDMARAVVLIWARIFRGNTGWPLINIIGDSLEHLAASMEGSNIWERKVSLNSI